jgi:hypothetical protein
LAECNARIKEPAIGHPHIVKQRAKIRLIHAQLLLHGLGRQTRLAPDNAAALRLPEARVDFLDRIGPGNIDRFKIVTQRGTAPPL